MKIFTPLVFQGNLNKKKYFEGWYFKHVSNNREHVLSFIPGIALTKADKHAFIQIIDGISGKTWNINYPLSEFSSSKNEFEIKVGKSVFTETGIELNIESDEITVKGKIQFANLTKYPATLFSPGIMGWYSFVPFMECKHGIGSVSHSLRGAITINNKNVNFSEGTGYIEKDWGTSFPESWIWLHCNTFNKGRNSFTFSVAKIPWLGNFFVGHICFLYFDDKFYLFATYNNSKIVNLKFANKKLEFELRNKNYHLKVTAVQKQSGNLKAPVIGEMNRIIKESVNSEIQIELFENSGELIGKLKGERAGLEVIEEILKYF
ncbi:MAG: hypothetical protein KAH68_07595 [Draconibacterium sp.]|nr:hypothetical protein [Draconibacterium sp.]